MRKVIFFALTVFAYVSHVYADGDDFCVYFYKQPNQEEEAGFICGELGAGEHVGRPNSNIPVVASLTAPDWMEIVLYNEKYYKGTEHVGQGNQAITPAFNVQSFKLFHK
jgi:hypothetical protein